MGPVTTCHDIEFFEQPLNASIEATRSQPLSSMGVVHDDLMDRLFNRVIEPQVEHGLEASVHEYAARATDEHAILYVPA